MNQQGDHGTSAERCKLWETPYTHITTCESNLEFFRDRSWRSWTEGVDPRRWERHPLGPVDGSRQQAADAGL